MLQRNILFILNLNFKFFGSVCAAYIESNKEAPTELGNSFLNDFYKQDALLEQKENNKMPPQVVFPTCSRLFGLLIRAVFLLKSGRLDSNQRPLALHASTPPNRRGYFPEILLK